MKGVGWKLTFMLAIPFAVVLADSPDLKLNSKSGDDAEENAAAKVASAEETPVEESESKRSWGNKPEQIIVVGNGNLNYPQQLSKKIPDQNEYGYLSDPAVNSTFRQPTSKLVPQSELVYAHNIPGASNIVTCSREGELYNLWTPSHQCLVCACVREQGWLRAVCASCSGCYTPDIIIPDPTPKPFFPTERPTAPPTPPAPIEEEVTCKPLPSGQPFENPLHPCQVCICIESLDAYGRPDVHIKCQENPQCVLPTDVPPMPPIPDEPVPSPYCDKFPTNVVFPHPSNNCKSCQCSVQISQQGVPEKLLICVMIQECKQTELDIIITEKPEVYPYVTPEPSWAPATLRPPPPGPLPGPSPHDSCKPYAPSQPFQHPWDECQVCVCMEAYSPQHINIELMCYTKLSCCIEPPFDLAPSSIPLVTIPQPAKGKIRIQDAVCELRTFGVEFVHPNDACKICTCELQGLVISSVCRRSYNPACSPPYPEKYQGTANIMANGAISYGSSQNKGSIRLGPPGATQSPLEWNTARPGLTLSPQQVMISSNKQVLISAQNGQNIQRPGALNHASGYLGNAGSYSQGYQVVPNAYSSQGYYSSQGHSGLVQQSASSLSSSAAGYHSLPYHPAQQYPAPQGWKGGQVIGHGSVSIAAQANAQALSALRSSQTDQLNKSPAPEGLKDDDSSKNESEFSGRGCARATPDHGARATRTTCGNPQCPEGCGTRASRTALTLKMSLGVLSEFATPSFLSPDHETSKEVILKEVPSIKKMHNVGFFNDAEHRGHKWYDVVSSSHSHSGDYMSPSSKTSSESDSSTSESRSSDASSFETSEKKILERKYRSCTPCPTDKLKKHTNIGIKWICGSYQRARRTFKSLCMMRYRNCQDGTMFVKIYDHRCKNDTFHGRHWFYVYRT